MALTATAAIDSVVRELDRRAADGVEVTLLWNANTNCVSVSVVENWCGSSVQYEVARAGALSEFRHAVAQAEQRRDEAVGA